MQVDSTVMIRSLLRECVAALSGNKGPGFAEFETRKAKNDNKASNIHGASPYHIRKQQFDNDFHVFTFCGRKKANRCGLGSVWRKFPLLIPFFVAAKLKISKAF